MKPLPIPFYFFFCKEQEGPDQISWKFPFLAPFLFFDQNPEMTRRKDHSAFHPDRKFRVPVKSVFLHDPRLFRILNVQNAYDSLTPIRKNDFFPAYGRLPKTGKAGDRNEWRLFGSLKRFRLPADTHAAVVEIEKTVADPAGTVLKRHFSEKGRTAKIRPLTIQPKPEKPVALRRADDCLSGRHSVRKIPSIKDTTRDWVSEHENWRFRV